MSEWVKTSTGLPPASIESRHSQSTSLGSYPLVSSSTTSARHRNRSPETYGSDARLPPPGPHPLPARPARHGAESSTPFLASRLSESRPRSYPSISSAVLYRCPLKGSSEPERRSYTSPKRLASTPGVKWAYSHPFRFTSSSAAPSRHCALFPVSSCPFRHVSESCPSALDVDFAQGKWQSPLAFSAAVERDWSYPHVFRFVARAPSMASRRDGAPAARRLLSQS
mmetsp:Transcript_3356/g.7581  ORF Transcript_3356/g.7581 Transcript_3356/m.7581 type:complete len:225 (-) Transcript_3356:743-1417(-)